MYLDCNSAASKDIMATWEHVIPRSLGGKDGYHNRKISCRTCNTIRGVEPFERFLKLRKMYSSQECKRIILGDAAILRKHEKASKRQERSKLHQLSVALDALYNEAEYPHPYNPKQRRSNWQVIGQNYQTAMKHMDRTRPLLWQAN
jgi:hypothetical protein